MAIQLDWHDGFEDESDEELEEGGCPELPHYAYHPGTRADQANERVGLEKKAFRQALVHLGPGLK